MGMLYLFTECGEVLFPEGSNPMLLLQGLRKHGETEVVTVGLLEKVLSELI
jgi:hypothetical protein